MRCQLGVAVGRRGHAVVEGVEELADLAAGVDLREVVFVVMSGEKRPAGQQQGNQHRDPRGWSITSLYFALIDFSKFEIQKTSTTEMSKWISIEEALQLELAFDHQKLLKLAFDRLCNKTRYTALPASLMPELFTLTELQTIYEIILGQTLEKKSFRRRMQEAGAVEETGQQKIVGKRPAQLFRLLIY